MNPPARFEIVKDRFQRCLKAVPRPYAAASIDWPSFNNDLASNRYAAPALITKSNVGRRHEPGRGVRKPISRLRERSIGAT